MIGTLPAIVDETTAAANLVPGDLVGYHTTRPARDDAVTLVGIQQVLTPEDVSAWGTAPGTVTLVGRRSDTGAMIDEPAPADLPIVRYTAQTLAPWSEPEPDRHPFQVVGALVVDTDEEPA